MGRASMPRASMHLGGSCSSSSSRTPLPRPFPRRGPIPTGRLSLPRAGAGSSAGGGRSEMDRMFVEGEGFVIYKRDFLDPATTTNAEDVLRPSSRALPSRQELERFNAFLLTSGSEDASEVPSSSLLPTLWSPDASAVQTDDESAASSSARINGSKRRTKVLRFTCNLCLTRVEKNINPHAWHHGTIVVQCGGCGVKHILNDNLGILGGFTVSPRVNPGRMN